jgi:NRAMP (natural resistance-associated macrophage protein)-like metal ion transporter
MKETFEKVVGAPAEALDRGVTTYRSWAKSTMNNIHIKRVHKYWQTLGPGLTTGASDDDPSGIATYSQTGAQYGYQLLWLAAFTFPFMALVQEMCARIGIVTGKGLAYNIRSHFPKQILFLCKILLFIANTLNLGADLGAMAKATQLLFPETNYFLLIFTFTGLSLGLQIFTSYGQYAKYLKFLALLLLSYVFSTLSIKSLDWSKIAQAAVIPSITFSKDQIFLICGILGTTISPYLFFWQTSQEVEHDNLKGEEHAADHRDEDTHKRLVKKELKEMKGDVWSGMFISNLVMFFIIVATAATLFTHGIKNINTAADAAAALRPIAGDQAYLLFALGVIGAGMLAIPVLAGAASYAIAESLQWKYGLYRKLRHAPSFYGVIMISMVIGALLNFTGIDPIKALLYSAVLNGLIAPLILVLIVLISSSKKIMGEFANSPFITLCGWIITGIMVVAGVATIISLFI